HMTRIVGVVSGKGGVGKTTLVSNLGVSMAQEGKKVAVIDANLSGANLGLQFGLISYPTSVHDVMRGNTAIGDAMYKHPSGVDIIPASLSIEDLDVEPRNIKREILDNLSDRDFVLIDCATGLDRETMVALEMCDEVLLVTHPELPTISDALRTKTIAKRYDKNIIGIVLNRVNRSDELKKENISAFFDLPVIGVIPEDHFVRKSIEAKNPIVLEYPRHRVSREIKRITHYMLGKEYKHKEGLLDRILSFFRI
ncbi:MAG TPA: septum site-determining protein MinD, partial [Candidatus Altiarchaeales archaeon]|nr:septum site-determining protein MinD [Candidatus Altiarchaeales archaeon]